MRRLTRGIIAGASLATSAIASSQDLFSSTNSTVHSYNYLEVQYLLDTEASPPVLATLLMDVGDNWSLKAEYLNQDFNNVSEALGLDALLLAEGVNPDSVNLDADLEAQAISVGALYHQPMRSSNQSDWIAGFMIGKVDASVNVSASAVGVAPFRVSETVDFRFQEFYAGIRRTLSTDLEGEVTLNVFRTSDDSDTTADIKLVYRVDDSLDVAFAVNELSGDDEFLGIGLRYTW